VDVLPERECVSVSEKTNKSLSVDSAAIALELAPRIQAVEEKLTLLVNELRKRDDSISPLIVSVRTVVSMLDLQLNNGNIHRVKRLLHENGIPNVALNGMSARYDVNDIRAFVSRMKTRRDTRPKDRYIGYRTIGKEVI
jgi:hypothetical protein